MAIAEAIVIISGSIVGQTIYALVTNSAISELDTTVATGLLSSIVYVSVARAGDLYRLPALIRPAEHMRRIVSACVIVLFALTAALFAFKIGSQVSRGAIVGFSVSMLVLCYAARLGAAGLIGRLMAQSAIVGNPVFLLGDAEELHHLTPAYLLQQFGLREVGRHVLDTIGQPRVAPPILEALQAARTRRASELLLAVPWDEAARLSEIEAALRTSPLPARLLPTRDQRAVIARCAPTRDCAIQLLDLQRAPLGLLERLAKRGLDIVGATIGLVLLSPVIACVVLAIRRDSPGPVVFRQRRNGFDQRPFTIFKFRTMHVLEDGAHIAQARRGDARVTSVGRMLRRTSLDEVPQLWNVLRGEMSSSGRVPMR